MTVGETIYIVVFQTFFNLRERERNRRGIMKFFIDTAKVEDIRKANDMGVICGVLLSHR